MQPKHVGENPQVMLKQIMSTARVLLKSCLNHALNSHHFPRQIQPKEWFHPENADHGRDSYAAPL